MTSIEHVRFDFKSANRNPHFRSGKQYESHELKQICPNLYAKKFKKPPVPRQLSMVEPDAVFDMTETEYKKSLVIRAQMRKVNVRDTIFMSHLAHDRTVTGKFKSEADRRKHLVRHFRPFDEHLSDQLHKI